MLQAGSEPGAEGRFHVLIREPVLPAPVAVRIAELSIDPSLVLLANPFGCLCLVGVHVFLSGWERGSVLAVALAIGTIVPAVLSLGPCRSERPSRAASLALDVIVAVEMLDLELAAGVEGAGQEFLGHRG